MNFSLINLNLSDNFDFIDLNEKYTDNLFENIIKNSDIIKSFDKNFDLNLFDVKIENLSIILTKKHENIQPMTKIDNIESLNGTVSISQNFDHDNHVLQENIKSSDNLDKIQDKTQDKLVKTFEEIPAQVIQNFELSSNLNNSLDLSDEKTQSNLKNSIFFELQSNNSIIFSFDGKTKFHLSQIID